MLKRKNYLVLVGLVAAGLLGGAGCPKPAPPDYLPYFIVSPTSLDFGTATTELTLTVNKNYTSQPLPVFSVTNNGFGWIQVTPSTGTSDGPDDPAEFTVTIDRDELAAGENTGSVLVTAPGIAPKTVPVTATAQIAADFSAEPQITTVGEMVQFTDSSGVSSDQAAITSWLWNFGDNTTSNSQSPAHIYAKTGTFSVSLTVSNGTLTDTELKVGYITVEPSEAPTARFVASDTTPFANTPVQFTDTSDAGSFPITAWSWAFGDGGTSTDQNPTHTYTQVANFTVSLTVTSAGGSDTRTRTNYISVQPQPPTADFDASDQTPAVNDVVNFTDTSDPGTSPIVIWFWEFGDGDTSADQNPNHMYTAAGVYSVYLSVTTAVGSDTELKTNFINVSSKKFLGNIRPRAAK